LAHQRLKPRSHSCSFWSHKVPSSALHVYAHTVVTAANVLLSAAVAFFNMVEIGVASVFKTVVEKHVDNGFFRASAWVFSSAIVHIPFALVNLTLFFTYASVDSFVTSWASLVLRPQGRRGRELACCFSWGSVSAAAELPFVFLGRFISICLLLQFSSVALLLLLTVHRFV
jgi:hypothetical protein